MKQQEYYKKLVVKLEQQEQKKQENKSKLEQRLEQHKKQRLKNEKKQKEQRSNTQWIQQFRQQNYYEALAMKLKRKEQQRWNNELKLYERLDEQDKQRFNNMPCIKFAKEGEEEKFEKERENLKKSFEKYRKNKEVIFPEIKQNSKEKFVKRINEDLFKKQKEAAKKFVLGSQKIYDRKNLNYNNLDKRIQIYRHMFDVYGNLLPSKPQKPPKWKLYAEAEKNFYKFEK